MRLGPGVASWFAVLHLLPRLARGDGRKVEPSALMVAGVEPQHLLEDRRGTARVSQAPRAEARAVQAAEERAVVDVAPRQHPVQRRTERQRTDRLTLWHLEGRTMNAVIIAAPFEYDAQLKTRLEQIGPVIAGADGVLVLDDGTSRVYVGRDDTMRDEFDPDRLRRIAALIPRQVFYSVDFSDIALC